MRKSKVAFKKIGQQTDESVFNAVADAMELVEWSAGLSPESFFLKVNLLSREVVPGQCTSPWVFEGVLRTVRERFPSATINFGDCEVATSRQVEAAVRNWGFLDIADRFDAKFVNLSRCPVDKVKIGQIFGRLDLPQVLLKSQAIITIPVVKTHCITPFTGALKNQWGLLPRARFKYHPVVHEAIVEVNDFFVDRIALGVADMTVAMEGPGPRVGTPKVCDVVLASRDLVALDTVAAQFMGFEREEVDFLLRGEAQGLGSMEADVVGDPFYRESFQRGEGAEYVVYRWRDRIGSLPLVKHLLVQDWFFKPLGWVATKYARHVWYRRTGRAQARTIFDTTGYGAQFEGQGPFSVETVTGSGECVSPSSGAV